ncbi:hypothetical protein [Streptomyces sp. NPDC007346]|uniref:hypothetical protein n=1 Tax=Streptomyces sp. NPDC007346 TaxID=3154682 RepID=UPI0034513DC6
MATYPYVHTWIDGGVQRQAQIHQSETGSEVVWDARTPGDPTPWQCLTHEGVRFRDDQITSR